MDQLFFASFAFCVITFEPIMIQILSAPQNDRQNFSFVKYIYVDGKKLARNGQKKATYYAASFIEGFYFRICQSLICALTMGIFQPLGYPFGNLHISFSYELKVIATNSLHKSMIFFSFINIVKNFDISTFGRVDNTGSDIPMFALNTKYSLACKYLPRYSNLCQLVCNLKLGICIKMIHIIEEQSKK